MVKHSPRIYGHVVVFLVVNFFFANFVTSLEVASVVPGGIEVEGRIRLSQEAPLLNMRNEFVVAQNKLNATKSVLPGQTDANGLIEALNDYVGALSQAIQLESSRMSAEERQVIAFSHFDASLLHLSSVLPIFAPSVAKTSMFYSQESLKNPEIDNWKQDWLVRLAMAVEEDSAEALDFDNTDHYILHDIFPLNLPAALYHLNKASLLGHTGARSLFTILSKIGSRSLLPSTSLPESTFDKPNSASSTSNTASQIEQTRGKSGTSETSKQSPDSAETPSTAAAPHSENANSPVKSPRKLSMADWKVLEHIFQDLSSAGKSPSALMLEGYQHLFGIDTQTAQCHVSKRVLREATAPLLELLKHQTPAPRLEFNQLALAPSKLPELYSGQSMGAHKMSSAREHMAYIDYYTDLAREPHQHHSKNTMGSIYLYGTFGYERDYSMAHRYYTEADSVQNPSANLGYLFHQGLGVPRDINRAVSQYSRAASQNSSFALTQLGLLFLRGDSEARIEPDIGKAMNFLTKAADKENPDANFHLGIIYRHGLPHFPADLLKAHKHIIFAATRGHLGAQLELAALTARCEDSVHLYSRVLSSALLHPLAFRAYEFYERGMYDHAAVLYNIMASLGHETGQVNAAWLHERGLVSTHLTPLDFANLLPLSVPSLAQAPHGAQTLASTHFKQSFDSLIARLNTLGSASESSALANLLLSSSRTSREHDEDQEDDNLHLSEMSDISDQNAKSIGEKEFASWEHQRHAFELYRMAAQQGNPEAQLKLGDFYYYGTGITPDYNYSAQLYLSAANSKHAQAAFNLGYMYQFGVGVPVDVHLAKRYYDQAIASSSDAYIPASIALIALQAQNFVSGSFDPLDIAWDHSLFAVLLISTLIAITLKFRIRNLA